MVTLTLPLCAHVTYFSFDTPQCIWKSEPRERGRVLLKVSLKRRSLAESSVKLKKKKMSDRSVRCQCPQCNAQEQQQEEGEKGANLVQLKEEENIDL